MTEFRILGSLEVSRNGRDMPLGGTRQRALLAILLLHRGEAVSPDRLIDELWGERPPDTATKTVQVYISRLRKLLGSEALLTRGGGYLLDVQPEQIDAHRFERLADEGRRKREAGDAPAAGERLKEALDLWRGPPLADLSYEQFAQPEIARLEELRLATIEERVEAELAQGEHAGLVPELENLVREHPTRERLRGQLMLALYRSGRQVEALESYREARQALAEQLGLEPGPELRSLEQDILDQDPALDGPAPRRARIASPGGRRGGALVLLGGGLLLAAALVAVVAGGKDKPEGVPVPGNSLAVIDPDAGRVVASVPTGVHPAEISSDGRRIWVANLADDTISEIDARRRSVVSTTAPPDVDVSGLAAGHGDVWIGDGRRSRLVRLNPVSRSVEFFPLASGSRVLGPAGPQALALGRGSIWVAGSTGTAARVDPDSGASTRVSVGNGPSAIASGAGGVWISDDEDNTVTRLDPASEGAILQSTPVGQGPRALAVGAGAVWVSNTQDDTVSRIDPRTASVTHTIPVGRRPTGVAVGAGAVWVANSLSGTLSRIDPRSKRVEATVDVGETPHGVTVAHGLVWVTVQRTPPVEPPPKNAAGGVARLLVAEDFDAIDPALGLDPQLQGATCALLYNYPDRTFPQGARLRPEVARGQPSISSDGRTYTFRIRRGFRFSPPSNEPVTAAAFKRAIERTLHPKAGASAIDLTAVVADVGARRNRLTLRVRRPTPDLPSLLAAPYFCAVPPDTPIAPKVDPVPSAGPYYVASRVPDRSLVLRRNPNYGGTRPSRLAEIRYSFGVPPTRAVAAVEAGRADYVVPDWTGEPGVSAATARRLEDRYGPASQAARGGRQQLFTQPVPNIYYFAFNTRRGPFADIRLRKAVNFAMDRRALALHTGTDDLGRPTDQHIPPGLPGFEDAAIYPLGGPDLATARRLAGSKRRRAVLYTCDFPGCSRSGQILRSNLSAIGIDLEVREFPMGELFERQGRQGEPFDIAYSNWFFDYADPFSYINLQFGDEGLSLGLFEGPRWQRRMDAAARLSGDARFRAYAKLDRELAAEAAPAAPFATATRTYFLSSRMGCQVLHPIYGLDLAALCIRRR